MKRSRVVFLALGSLSFAALGLGFTIALAKPQAVRLASPSPGSAVDLAFDAAGDAWFPPDAGALASVLLVARGPEGRLVETPMERLVVKDRGRPLLALSRWRGRVTLPVEGGWSLVAEARSTGGLRIASSWRRVEAEPGGARAFVAFSPSHWIPVLLILVAALGAALVVRLRGGIPPALAWAVSAAVWANDLLYQSVWFAQGGWSASASLMAQICGLSILAIPFALLLGDGRTRDRLAGLLWFWGMGGATQALLSPDLGASGFPSLRFVCFFLSHGLIIVAAAVLAAESPKRIDLRALGRAFLATNMILVPMALLDAALALLPSHDPGNYFLLSYPPPEGSPVDYLAAIFGPAPRYLPGLEFMALAVFLLLWAPFALARRLGGSRRPVSAGPG